MAPDFAADLIVTDANLITLDDAAPRASAMCVFDGKIVYVGDDVTAERFSGPRTARLPLGGRTLIPGFCDAHVHLFWCGRQLLTQADLVGTQSIEDILSRLDTLSRERSERADWLQGHGFDQDKLAERRFPTRADLDRVSRDRPIIVSRICGHAAVVNSAALTLVTEAERAKGDPQTGLYTEGDIRAFYRRIPPLVEEEMETAALLACDVALRTGITSVHTLLDTPEQMIAWSRLRRAGKLPLRVTAMPAYAAVEQLHAHGVRSGLGDDRLRFGAAKLFSDGSLGARTALLASPYSDLPITPESELKATTRISPNGIRIYEPEDLKHKARDAQIRGFQLAIHAIGDQAVRETLDAIEHALAGQSNEHHRHRIEHVSLCPPDCLERMAERKIVAVVQPQFVPSDSWTPDRIGHSRVPWAYAFKSLLEAGVPLALSSDCPVEKLDAFACLAAAVGRAQWSPHETLTPLQAIRAYCLGGAYAAHAESFSGSLTPGKVADFVVLSEDPTHLNASQIERLKAERVFIGGKELTPSPAVRTRPG
jgi:predicted amidohydrolase YtcJ